VRVPAPAATPRAGRALALITILIASTACVQIVLGSAPASSRGEEPRSSPANEATLLTNEDVVRMMAAGVPAERILARIQEAPAAFDVAEDMIEELRIAGVPREIIAAMVEKSRQRARGPSTIPASPARQGRGLIEIVFGADPEGSPASNSFAVPARITDPNSPLNEKDTFLAFFVVCTHTLHVPDGWAGTTSFDPSMERHQVLFFQEATKAASGRKEKGFVYLPHPDQWRFEADAGEHRGYLGVALRLGPEGKYLPVGIARYDSIVVAEGSVTRVEVKLRTSFGAPRRKGPGDVVEQMEMTHIGTVGNESIGPEATVEIVKISDPEPASAAAPRPPGTPPPPPEP